MHPQGAHAAVAPAILVRPFTMPYNLNHMDEIMQIAKEIRESGRLDVITLAKRLGLAVFSMTDLKDAFKHAYIKKDNGTFSIYVNPDQTRQRQRFSIAHEIAHYYLHREQLVLNGMIDRDSSKSLSTTEERDADRLASRILMPDDDIKNILGNTTLPQDIKLFQGQIEDLAKRYDVSFSAMVVRLRELGYYVPFISAYGD